MCLGEVIGINARKGGHHGCYHSFNPSRLKAGGEAVAAAMTAVQHHMPCLGRVIGNAREVAVSAAATASPHAAYNRKFECLHGKLMVCDAAQHSMPGSARSHRV